MGTENDIRCQVTRRKVSAGTRSNLGRGIAATLFWASPRPAPGTVWRSGTISPRKGDGLSSRERIGTQLKINDLARRSLPALGMERRSSAIGRPEPTFLPPTVRIIDAAVHALGVKAHRVGDAQNDELSVDQCQKGIVSVTSGDRDIGAEAESVELINPGVVARLGARRTRRGRDAPRCAAADANRDRDGMAPVRRIAIVRARAYN
jgi:hypothetical protein